jgi:hypothetical protein
MLKRFPAHPIFFFLLAPVAAIAAPPSPDLAWMAGHWTGHEGPVVMEEHWTGAEGGALVGMHKDVKGDAMTSFEFVRIARDGGGVWTYFAQPQGQAPTEFRLKEQARERVVFENPAHDFPQRVLYWRTADGALHARIEGTVGGKAEAMEWSWTKAQR